MRCFWSIFVALVVFTGLQPLMAQKCAAPECRQFDFWIGEWELSWTDKEGNPVTGKNTIKAILDSCVIQEEFIGPSFRGISVSVYNIRKSIWQQTWVDNNGGYLDFTGKFTGDNMVLSRTADLPTGKRLQRMTWYNITTDRLDWDWEISDDNGMTWNLAWRIHYRRKSD